MNRKMKIITTVGLVVTLVLLLATGYNIYAKATNEMLSRGNGLPAGFPYITYCIISSPA